MLRFQGNCFLSCHQEEVRGDRNRGGPPAVIVNRSKETTTWSNDKINSHSLVRQEGDGVFALLERRPYKIRILRGASYLNTN